MRSKAGPASRELKTVAELERFIGNEEHSVVGKFNSLIHYFQYKQC